MSLQTRCASFVLFVIAVVIVGGCADKSAAVSPTRRAERSVLMPDQIVIKDFSVTPEEAKLDQGVMTSPAGDTGSPAQTAEEIEVGHRVARKLSRYLMENLRSYGIVANLDEGRTKPSKTTAELHGQFVTANGSSDASPETTGFSLGRSSLTTRIQIFQDGERIAEANTSTPTRLKSGTLESLDEDAKRTAKAVAEQIRQAYVNRGWL